ncbi:MAG TPA: GNAT family N-acetyltransferase [Kofleriaceae bacterium]|nr:GNAT family N-acetyltransferase [Kofleriaceae bacterium]
MKLRPAIPGDELSVARIHVRAWQAGYRGLLPAGYLESLRPEDRARRYTFGRADGPRTTVALDEGVSEGPDEGPGEGVSEGPDEGPGEGPGKGPGEGPGNGPGNGSSDGSRDGSRGNSIVGFMTIHGAELCALHVDPDRWSRGVGRALIERARADLAAAGAAEAHVWVLVGNERALRFYERDGWAADGTHRSDTVWGVLVDELQLRRRL